MKVYISGPMTGKPEYNRVEFEEAAYWLRREGFEVISPIELDAAGGFNLQGPLTAKAYWEFLGRDMHIIAESNVDGIVVLNDWWLSKGSRLEVFQALMLRIQIIEYATLTRIEPENVMHMLLDSIS